MIVPFFVGRKKSVSALEEVMKDDKQILIVTQKNAAEDDPASADLYEVGTIGTVLQLLKLPDGTAKVLVEGVQRARRGTFTGHEFLLAVEAEGPEERQEERRGGDEWVSACRSRWRRDPYTKTRQTNK